MKPQTRRLVEYLNNGGEITRDTAWRDFGIQNATARVSELAANGYPVIKKTVKARVHGRKVAITSWRLRECIRPGLTVRVLTDAGNFLSPRGHTGTVEKINLETATATVFIAGLGYRSLSFKDLQSVPHLKAGTKVAVKPSPYVVLEYFPDINSYLLQSPVAEHTIVAHASLMEGCP